MSLHSDPIGRLSRSLRPLFPSRDPEPESWQSVLILRPCCIGDVLQSTALVAALRRRFPEARIGYAVGPWSRPVIEGNPHLSEIVDTGPVIGGRRGSWTGYGRLIGRLRRGQWDACFILERSPLFSLAAWMAQVPHRIGLDNAGRGVALTTRVPLRPRRQEAEAALDLARAVGIPTEGALTEFYPSEADHQEVARLLPDSDQPWVVLAPGGGVNPGAELLNKRWPAERFGELAARLAALGYRPLIIGGSSDRPLAEAVMATGGDQTVSLCGRLSLTGCGALLQRSRLLVGNDTGVMHLAAAVKTPVLALFGPTDPAMYGPYGVRHRSLWHPRHCSPCFRQAHRRADCALECMYSIGVDEAEDAAIELLQ